MADGIRVTPVDPYRVINSAGHPDEFDLVSKRCLAQGDSWFSLGAIPIGATSNILAQMALTRAVAVVNCARPGKVLGHMADMSSDPIFMRLFTGRLAVGWDAVLVSGGGNDLIDAASVGPAAPPSLRLLATAAERGPNPASGDAYVSAPGWATFETHLTAVFEQLVAYRDTGPNQGVPMVFHTYAHIMPRPSPVGLGKGPWLQPSMLAFEVPPADWLAVSNALIDRLAILLGRLVASDPARNLHLVDSRVAPLVLGDPASSGVSGDFANEIHPTRGGYTKLAATWRGPLDTLLA